MKRKAGGRIGNTAVASCVVVRRRCCAVCDGGLALADQKYRGERKKEVGRAFVELRRRRRMWHAAWEVGSGGWRRAAHAARRAGGGDDMDSDLIHRRLALGVGHQQPAAGSQ